MNSEITAILGKIVKVKWYW